MLPLQENVSTLGEWVRLNRTNYELSQKELSQISQLSQSLISQIEKGVVHDISIHTLFKLLGTFNAEIRDVADFFINQPQRELNIAEKKSASN